MKYFLIIAGVLLFINGNAQSMTPEQWKAEAATNIRLLPKYGNLEKTEAQKKADDSFIAETIKQEQFAGNRTAASNSMIALGFKYLGDDNIKIAMYRFNQAFLLDSANTDIYWGYGAVYMKLGFKDLAFEQYEEGLKLNPSNPHLLTDYGTYFLGEYYANTNLKDLEKALQYLLKSYKLEKKNVDTLFKLSVVYLIKDDCKNAQKYYKECKAFGGAPISDDFTKELNEKCK
jgi:tetratricopeptide (TPR) repeat protein